MVFKEWDCVKAPNFEEFCKKLTETFPESMGEEKGSRAALNWVIQQFAVIYPGQQEVIKVYSLYFMSQCQLLLEPPAIIPNADVVALYFLVFDDQMIAYIHQRLQVAVAPAKCAERHLEDPYTLEEVMDAATGADMGPTVQALYKLASSGPSMSKAVLLNAESSFRGTLAIPFAKELLKSDQGYLEGFHGSCIKKEDNSEDKARLSGTLDKFENVVKDVTGVKEHVNK